MALIPVIQCSGGEISDWDGNPIRSGWDGTVLLQPQSLHQMRWNFSKTDLKNNSIDPNDCLKG